jgi:septum formation protein
MQEEAEGPFQAPSPALVLASGSVTRRTLLAATGLRFTSFSPDIDEAAVKLATRREGGAPEHAAMALARMKAAAWQGSDGLVIGCDQILVCGGMWFDKPANLDMARQHLQHLRGRTHTLVTATVCARNGAKVWSHLAKPLLTMRTFSPAFLEAYLDAEGEALLHTVGAYRVEGAGAHLFEAIEGEHSAILGLPLIPLLGFLRGQGVVIG